MNIRTADSCCRRPQLLLGQFFLLTLDRALGFFIFQTTTGRFEKWGGRQFYTKYDLLTKGCLLTKGFLAPRLIICKAFFAPEGEGGGGSPLYSLYGYVRCQRVWFSAALVWNRVSSIKSEIGCGLCTLHLNWLCFLEELATSSSFCDKTISPLMFTPTTVYVP